MSDVNLAVLTKIALGKLSSCKPKTWDTDARELYERAARLANPEASEDLLEGAWRDALIQMRDNSRDEWDAYVKFNKRPQDASAVPWDKVKLISGQADGDTFELRFLVDGMPCVVECTDVQLLDASFILRKLVMYTRKDVACPYLGKKQVEAWRRNVVLDWLKSDAFRHVERETMGSVVENLIREYCANTITAESGPEVWKQLKHAILDKGVIYVPFAGLQDFVGRRAGNDPSKKSIKNALHRLGFNEVKKGRNALRFHSISSDSIYEETHSGEAGGGEVDPDSEDRRGNAGEGRDSVFNLIREEERTRSPAESGERAASPETQTGKDHLSDDSLDPF